MSLRRHLRRHRPAPEFDAPGDRNRIQRATHHALCLDERVEFGFRRSEEVVHDLENMGDVVLRLLRRPVVPARLQLAVEHRSPGEARPVGVQRRCLDRPPDRATRVFGSETRPPSQIPMLGEDLNLNSNLGAKMVLGFRNPQQWV